MANLYKKGDATFLETLIFIVLNLIFFFIIMIFVYNAGTQSFIYEQSYAKQIALIVDNAEPDMAVMIKTDDLIPFLAKSNKPLDKVFSVNPSNNEVRVSLSSSGGYSYRYFSNNDVTLKTSDGWLSIIVKKKVTYA